VNFQQLVSQAEAKAANQGYDVAKLPVMTPSGETIGNVHVRTVAAGKKAVWAVVVEP
jgi:hypothetical protein